MGPEYDAEIFPHIETVIMVDEWGYVDIVGNLYDTGRWSRHPILFWQKRPPIIVYLKPSLFQSVHELGRVATEEEGIAMIEEFMRG